MLNRIIRWFFKVFTTKQTQEDKEEVFLPYSVKECNGTPEITIVDTKNGKNIQVTLDDIEELVNERRDVIKLLYGINREKRCFSHAEIARKLGIKESRVIILEKRACTVLRKKHTQIINA